MTRSRDTADQINRINSSAANATAITVDSSENVSLTGALDVTGTVTSDALAVSAATNNYASITATNSNTRAGWLSSGKKSDGTEIKTWIRSEGDGGIGVVFTETNHNLGFATNNAAPQMTLDTSGNLMTVKTAVDTDAVGSELRSNGLVSSTRTGAEALFLNRKSSDGNIAVFAKDGSTVGSIAMEGSGPQLTVISTAEIRLKSPNTTTDVWVRGEVKPWAGGQSDLGDSIYSWKDLYLSGGVVFGPASGSTVSSQTLDSYEEGTYTLSDQSGAGLSLSVYVATYTKIGNQVFFEFGMIFPTTSNTADIRLSLPFTAISSADNTGGGSVTTTNSGRNDSIVVLRNNASMSVQTNLNAGATNANYSGKQLRVAGQFTVA